VLETNKLKEEEMKRICWLWAMCVVMGCLSIVPDKQWLFTVYVIIACLYGLVAFAVTANVIVGWCNTLTCPECGNKSPRSQVQVGFNFLSQTPMWYCLHCHIGNDDASFADARLREDAKG
jgi:hypothetical protein